MVTMAYIVFVITLIVTGTIASLVDVDTCTSRYNQPDYHFVPFSGDAFGA